MEEGRPSDIHNSTLRKERGSYNYPVTEPCCVFFITDLMGRHQVPVLEGLIRRPGLSRERPGDLGFHGGCHKCFMPIFSIVNQESGLAPY